MIVSFRAITRVGDLYIPITRVGDLYIPITRVGDLYIPICINNNVVKVITKENYRCVL